MHFAIMRCAKLSSFGSVAASLQHCFRERETLNADAARSFKNQHAAASRSDEALGSLRSLLPEKRRKDAVLCIEYMMSASPEWFQTSSEAKQAEFFKEARQWLEKKYGADRVIVSTVHNDETTPHLTAYVVPLTKDGRLSAKDFIGNKSKMSADQSSFAKSVGKLGLKRGIEGSEAAHTTIKEFYQWMGADVPEKSAVELPKPSLTDKLSPTAYAEKVADVANAAIDKAHAIAFAKHKKAQMSEQRLQDLEHAADNLRMQAEYFEKRSEAAEQIVLLFTEEEIESARECMKKREAEQKNFEQAEKLEQERQRRIDALPILLKNAAGAARTFIDKALVALRQVSDSKTVEWGKVEGSAIREAIAENGQSVDSTARAICELSPLRVTKDSHRPVYQFCEENGPKYIADFERSRGNELGNELR